MIKSWWRVCVSSFDFDEVSKQIDKLIGTTTTTTTTTTTGQKTFTIVKLMKQIVPEFISNNSIYEQLDPQ